MIAALLVLHLAANSIDFARNKNTRPERLEQMEQKLEVVEHLRGIDGRVLSLDPALAVLSGHPMEYQPFMFRALADLGAWDPEPLVREVRERRFVAVVWVVHNPVAGFEIDRDGRQVPYFAGFKWIADRNFPKAVCDALVEGYERDPRLDRVIEKVNDLYFLGYEVWVPKKP